MLVKNVLRLLNDLPLDAEICVQWYEKEDMEKHEYQISDDVWDMANRKNKKKVRAYLRKTQDDRVARNGDRAKAIKKHGKAKMRNHDVHHPNGPQNGGGTEASGTGGLGGGGFGGTHYAPATNGVANTGGGGGANWVSSMWGNGLGNGGSGVVVVRFPLSFPAGAI